MEALLITPVMLPLCTIHYVLHLEANVRRSCTGGFAMNNLLWYNYVNFETDVECRVGVAASVLRLVLCISGAVRQAAYMTPLERCLLG